MRDDYEQTEHFHRNTLVPYLISNGNNFQIFASIFNTSAQSGNTSEIIGIHVLPNVDHSKLLSRPDFQGIIGVMIGIMPQIYLPNHPTIDDKLDEVISLLEQELKQAAAGRTVEQRATTTGHMDQAVVMTHVKESS